MEHVPVLLDRVTELALPALQHEGAVLVDGTLGLGGHAAAILAAAPQVHLVGIDRDEQALAEAERRLAPFAGRITLVHAVAADLEEVLERTDHASVSAVLLDLGVSSLQLDAVERGFSYARDAPLDMRMDQRRGRTASEVVNSYSVGELARVLRVYGEERFARRIAQAIDRERQREPFTGTERLAEVVRTAVPAATRRTGGHPAKRTFQALRIEVNAELSAWQSALPAAIAALRVGGRIAVLSYHSLEDRITKRALALGATSSAPVGLPVELPEHTAYLKLLTRGAEEPSAAEVATNPRAASVRLRAAERVRRTKGPVR